MASAMPSEQEIAGVQQTDQTNAIQPSTSTSTDESRPFLSFYPSKPQKKWTFLMFFCTCPDVLFLVLKVIALCVTASVAVVRLLSSKKTHGECMLTASYSRLGYVDYGTQQFPCDFVLYYTMISSAFLLMSMMIDWIADIKDSIRWLVMQIIMLVSVAGGMAAVSVILILTFLQWCDNIATALPMSKTTDRCRSNVVNYQKMPEQNYKLVSVYDYTLAEMVLCVSASVLWLIMAVAASWKLRVTIQEQRRNLEEDERDDDDEDDGVTHKGFNFGAEPDDAEPTTRNRAHAQGGANYVVDDDDDD